MRGPGRDDLDRIEKRTLTYGGLALVALMILTAGLVACEESEESSREREAQQKNYSQQVNSQPADTMDYSPTRRGLNQWMETWEEEGKEAYVYFYAADGSDLGYYVLEGLPVSYCASLTPTDREMPDGGESGAVAVTAPSMDGVYYSGNNCIQYFGYDAETGAYLEWTAGGSLNFFVSDSPLNRPNSKPLATATIENVQGAE